MVGDGRQDGRYQVTHAPFPAPSHLLLATDALWWYNAASMQPRPTQPLAPVPLSRVCPGHGWLATCPRCVDQPSAFSQGAELLLRPAFNLGGSASLAFEDADHWTSRGAAARCQRWRLCPRIVHTGSTCCHARAERLYMPACMQQATAQDDKASRALRLHNRASLTVLDWPMRHDQACRRGRQLQQAALLKKGLP